MRSTREDEGDKRQQVGRLIERIEAASGEARDDETPRGDATLQAPTHESTAVLPETLLTAAASTVLVDVQGPSTDSVDRPPDLYLRNCSFLC